MNALGPSGTADDRETEITLGLLSAVSADSSLTQRKVASSLGIALGLANAYLRRCIRKGYVKVQEVPSNRYAYYLTPTGFAEKARLTAEYFSQSLRFFRVARDQCGALFTRCEENGWTRIALWGDGDLAEIALLCANERGITLLGVVAAEGVESVAGLRAVRTLDTLGAVDAVIITDFRAAQLAWREASRAVGPDRVLCPSFLGVVGAR